jgi:hypothetical protein
MAFTASKGLWYSFRVSEVVSFSITTDETAPQSCYSAGPPFFSLAADPESDDRHDKRCRRNRDHPFTEVRFIQVSSPPITAKGRGNRRIALKTLERR